MRLSRGACRWGQAPGHHLTRLERWPPCAPSRSEPSLYAAIGVHPNESGGHPPFSVEDLLSLAEHPKVVGIGESGLDYHYDFAPRDQQARSFRLHIEAARQSGLPLIVQAREADADMIAILRDESERNGAFPCVLHCFSSGQALAEAALALGHLLFFRYFDLSQSQRAAPDFGRPAGSYSH